MFSGEAHSEDTQREGRRPRESVRFKDDNKNQRKTITVHVVFVTLQDTVGLPVATPVTFIEV